MSEENLKQPLEENKPVNSDASKQLDDFVKIMPDVVPEAVATAQAKEAEALKQAEDIKDPKGRAFDPNIHAVDANGKPQVTPTGRFKKKLNLPKDSKVNLPEQEKQNNQDPTALKIKIASAKWADMFIIFGISLFGEEWKPDVEAGYNERDTLIMVNERYMQEKGYVEAPAWLDLACAYGLYSMKRFNRPTTKTRFGLLWNGLKNWGTNLWLKMTGKKIRVVSEEQHKKDKQP